MPRPHSRPSPISVRILRSRFRLSHTQALDRRQTLDAQQRTYREPTASREPFHIRGRPVRAEEPRKPQRINSTTGADQACSDVDIKFGDLAGGQLWERDAGHRRVVGAERRRRYEELDASLDGHLSQALPKA